MKEIMLLVVLTLQCIHAQSNDDNTYKIIEDPINFDTYIPFNQQIEHQAQEILHPDIQTIVETSQQKEEASQDQVEEHTVEYWIQRMNHEYPDEFDMQEKDIIFAQTTPVVEEVKQIIDDLVVAASTEQENPGTVDDDSFDQLETTLELIVDKAQVDENFGTSFIDVNEEQQQYEMSSQEKMAFELYTPQQHFMTDNQEDNKLYKAFEQPSKEEFWEEMKKKEDQQEQETQTQHNQEQQNFYEDIDQYINMDNNLQQTNSQEFQNKIKKQNEQNKVEKKQRIEQVKSEIEEELKSNKLKIQGDSFNNEKDYIDWKIGQNQKDIMFMMQSGNLRQRL